MGIGSSKPNAETGKRLVDRMNVRTAGRHSSKLTRDVCEVIEFPFV